MGSKWAEGYESRLMDEKQEAGTKCWLGGDMWRVDTWGQVQWMSMWAARYWVQTSEWLGCQQVKLVGQGVAD